MAPKLKVGGWQALQLKRVTLCQFTRLWQNIYSALPQSSCSAEVGCRCRRV